jgi:hypothetical protein
VAVREAVQASVLMASRTSPTVRAMSCKTPVDHPKVVERLDLLQILAERDGVLTT